MEKVRELFLAAVKDYKLQSYVILNFKASKLDRPVMSWSDKEWKALIEKFAFFREKLTEASSEDAAFYKDEELSRFLYADSALWGELEDKLAEKILKDYRRS